MPKPKSEKAPAIDLNQLPPWLEMLEPELREAGEENGWLDDPGRMRRLASIFNRWTGQLLDSAALLDTQHQSLAKRIEAGDPRVSSCRN